MAQRLRVAVAGANGRMGTVARAALERNGEYCCGFARAADPEHQIFDSLEQVFQRRPDVLLDLTTQPASYDVSLASVTRGVPTVVGASGWTAEQRERLATIASERNVGVLLVPNFSVGAMLMMRFAREAARFFATAEIIELHHVGKKDKPSGTAQATAAQIETAGAKSPPIHSVRLPGLLAHQEVLFGGPGELLTIRHDSFTRDSFVTGMMAAVRAVGTMSGLSVGFDLP